MTLGSHAGGEISDTILQGLLTPEAMIADRAPSLRCGRMISLDRWLFQSLGMARDTFKYHFKIGNRIVHTGITTDLEKCEQAHKSTFGATGHIKTVGRATTRDAALKWEGKQTQLGNPTRRVRP